MIFELGHGRRIPVLPDHGDAEDDDDDNDDDEADDEDPSFHSVGQSVMGDPWMSVPCLVVFVISHRTPVFWIDAPVLRAKVCSFMVLDTSTRSSARPASFKVSGEDAILLTSRRAATMARGAFPRPFPS